MTETIHDICLDTVRSAPTLELADADAVVDTLTERIIKILTSDPELSARSTDTWCLMLADVASRSVDELGELIEGSAKLSEVVTEIARALAARAAENRTAQNSPKRLDAEVTP
jgi:hypothetical protein